METAGLVSRTPESGRNQTALTLTSNGIERLADACAIEAKLGEKVIGNLDEESRRILLSALACVLESTARYE